MTPYGAELVETVARAIERFVEGSLSRAGEPPRWHIHDTFDRPLRIVATFSDRVERDAVLRTMNARAALAATFAALQTPSGEILDAGFGRNAPTIWTAAITPEDRAEIWRAMLAQVQREIGE